MSEVVEGLESPLGADFQQRFDIGIWKQVHPVIQCRMRWHACRASKALDKRLDAPEEISQKIRHDFTWSDKNCNRGNEQLVVEPSESEMVGWDLHPMLVDLGCPWTLRPRSRVALLRYPEECQKGSYWWSAGSGRPGETIGCETAGVLVCSGSIRRGVTRSLCIVDAGKSISSSLSQWGVDECVKKCEIFPACMSFGNG